MLLLLLGLAALVALLLVVLLRGERVWGHYVAERIGRATDTNLRWERLDLRSAGLGLTLGAEGLALTHPNTVSIEVRRLEVTLGELWGPSPRLLELEAQGVTIRIAEGDGEESGDGSPPSYPELPFRVRGQVRGVVVELPAGHRVHARGVQDLEAELKKNDWRLSGRVEAVGYTPSRASGPPWPELDVHVIQVQLAPSGIAAEGDVLPREERPLRAFFLLPMGSSGGAMRVGIRGPVSTQRPEVRQALTKVGIDPRRLAGAADLEGTYEHAEGELEAKLRLESETLRVYGVPVAAVMASVRGGTDDLTGTLEARTGAGFVRLNGSLRGRQRVQVQGELSLQPLALLQALAIEAPPDTLPRRVQGTVALTGDVTAPRLWLSTTLTSSTPPVVQRVLAQPVRSGRPWYIEGRALFGGGEVLVQHLAVDGPGTRVEAQGRAWPTLAMKAELRRDAPLSFAGWSAARLQLQTEVHGRPNRLEGRLDGWVRALSGPPLGERTVNASMSLWANPSQITLRAATIRLDDLPQPLELKGTFALGSGDFAGELQGAAALRFAGSLGPTYEGLRRIGVEVDTLDLAKVSLFFDGAPRLAGVLRGRASVELSPRALPSWYADLWVSELSLDGEPPSPHPWRVRTQPASASQQALLIEWSLHLALRGSFDRQQATLTLAGGVRSLSLKPWMPPGGEPGSAPVVSTGIELQADLQPFIDQGTAASIRAAATFSDLLVRRGELDVRARKLHLLYDEGRLIVDPTVIESAGVAVSVRGMLLPYLDMSASGDLPLEAIASVTDAVTARGALRADLRVHGELGAPNVEGAVTLATPVSIIADALPATVEVSRGRVTFSGAQMVLHTLQATMGEGRLEAQGVLNLALATGDGAPEAERQSGMVDSFEVSLRGRDIPFAAGDVYVVADADLTWGGVLSSSRVRGDVAITRGRVQRRVEVKLTRLLTGSGPPAPPVLLPSWASAIALDVNVESHTTIPVSLEAGIISFSADTEVTTRLSGSVGVPQAHGAIRIIGGEAVFPASTLDILPAMVSLDGRIVEARIIAEGEVEPQRALGTLGSSGQPYWVNVRLEGNTQEGVELHLSSTPPENELEVLALLVNGVPPGEQGDADLLTARAAMAFVSDEVAGYLLGHANQRLRNIMGESFRLRTDITEEGLRFGAEQTLTSRASLTVGVEQPWQRSALVIAGGLELVLTDALRVQSQLLSLQDYGATQSLRSGSEARFELKYRVIGP